MMQHFTSMDGTQIAYERTGTGPPLVLVHGTDIDHTQWARVTPGLEQHFTVYAIDRRGRGRSGDAQPYAIQREFEDVAAMVDAIPGTVSLFGHSYGAICSLEAALLTTHIRRLALYEPPIYTSIELSYPAGVLENIKALLNAGEAEKVLLLLNDLAQTPKEELNLIRSLPSWQARIDAVNTILREQAGARDYRLVPDRIRKLETPTLLLVGSETHPFYRASTEALHSLLPNNQVVVFPGQGHEAMDTAPELFLQRVVGFFGAA